MVERGPVTRVITERVASGSRPGYRQDDFKVGLVLEGGAMRSVVTGGETLAFSHLGLLPSVDAVYGVSAGSAAGAYLLARQSESLSIYFQDINNRRFIDLQRAFSRQPILDLYYLTHHIMKYVKPLDWRQVVDSPQELHIFVTNAKNGQPLDLNHFSSQEELLIAIHGSCRIPLIAGLPLKIDENTYYTDGGVTVGGGLAVEAAATDGCTHILVLQSKPDQESYLGQMKDPSYLFAYFILRRDFPELARILFRVRPDYVRNYNLIKAAEKEPDRFPVAIEGVRVPAGTSEVSMLEIDKRRLVAGAQAGKRALIQKFKLS